MQKAEEGGQRAHEWRSNFCIRRDEAAQQKEREASQRGSTRDANVHSHQAASKPRDGQNPQHTARGSGTALSGKKSERNHRNQIFWTQEEVKDSVVDRAEADGRQMGFRTS